ncbi:MAG: hypothetical protein JWM27_4867 [Gemmatimonadetes bacterium]|nr:hypothetical protein [Gemmatimonadota bacterium]
MSAPPPRPLRLEALDASFHLTPEQKARLRPEMDAAAVEHLVRWLLPEDREAMLANFSIPPVPEYVPGKPYRVSNQTIVGFSDPVLQTALEAIWAPIWARATDAQLIRQADAPFPGLDAERRKRQLDDEVPDNDP